MYNDTMKYGWDGARRRGFTIIEVMLFLAISGFLLVGILVGTGAGIARQRYTDSVQHVAQILREQYSAVINTQIPARDSANGGACYSPSPDDLMDGGQISDALLYTYYDKDNNAIAANAGRGRTTCLVYGVMVTLGLGTGDENTGSTIIQSTTLVGKDIDEVVKENPGFDVNTKSDLEILQKAGVNNLTVVYDVSGGSNNLQCYVRTTENNLRYNLQWEAKTEDLARDSNLERTIIIFRSPKDGSVRTYVMNRAIRMQGDTGDIVNYANINSLNDGKGMGLKSETSGACGGAISAGAAGYGLLREAGVNRYLTKANFTNANDLEICVGSKDVFSYASQRRMIKLARDGHNAGAVELIDAEDLRGENRCQ